MYRFRPIQATALAAAVSLGAALTACDVEKSDTSLEPQAYSLPLGQVEHADQLAAVEASLSAANARVAQRPDSWMNHGQVASALNARARLTGELQDLVQAQARLDEAFSVAVEGSGTRLVRANTEFSLHRFDDAASSLDALDARILIDDPTRAAIAGLRGDLALQSGDVDTAASLLEQAEVLDPSSTSASRLAHLQWRRGDYETAEAGYLEGLSRYHGNDAAVPAWFHLQLGILDLERDDLEGALEHFFDANDELSGYYLIEEHIAEVWTLQGHTERALGLYLDIIDRTGNPEFMDAVAGIYADAGDDKQSEIWVERARAGYEAQLELAPEAAYGHAIGHYVDFGDPEQAVLLAEKNHELRPNPGAKAELLTAYLAAGQLDDAVVLADVLADAKWRTAETLEAALEAYGAAELDRTSRAMALQEELCVFAPKKCD